MNRCRLRSLGSLAMTACMSSLLYADGLAENQARFGRVTGTVEVLQQGDLQWKEARTDLPIESGDQIQVGEESEAELSIAQNVLWLLEENTNAVVQHLTEREGRVTLSQGALLGKVETGESGVRSSWEFETPAGVVVVRGTEFVLTHSSEDGTHLGVLKGVVAMKPAENATQTFSSVIISAREEGVISKKEPFKKMAVFSSVIQKWLPRAKTLPTRFHAHAQVWSPFTAEYRKELRLKILPAVVPRKPGLARPARPARRLRKPAP